MPADEFVLHTRWRVHAPVDRVWEAIHHPEQWPNWWPFVRRVENVAPGDELGVGAVRRFTWTSRLPYSLTFTMRVTRVDRPRHLEGEASGELEGRGIWRLAAEGPDTLVHYEWRVRVTRAWMRLLAPLLRPAFAWNHNAVMAGGAAGLARWLGVAVRQE